MIRFYAVSLVHSGIGDGPSNRQLGQRPARVNVSVPTRSQK